MYKTSTAVSFFFLWAFPSSNRVFSLFMLALSLDLLLFPSTARAYSPLAVSDSEIAQGAELVVVARLKEGSVEYLRTEEKHGRVTVSAFVPHAQLLITEVADGRLDEKEITVWFFGNTLPIVGGKFDWDYGKGLRKKHIHIQNMGDEYQQASVQIGELNTSFYLRDDLKDLREPHVWFLVSRKGVPRLAPAASTWCIENWQCVKQVDLKDYYLAYRAADPKKALLSQLPKYPLLADEITRYIDRQRVVESQQGEASVMGQGIHATEANENQMPNGRGQRPADC